MTVEPRYVHDRPIVSGGTLGNALLDSVLAAMALDGLLVNNSTTQAPPQTPNAPVVGLPTSIGSSSFVANCSAPAVDVMHDAAVSYVLDVASDVGFTTLVSGYNNASTGSARSTTVSGLNAVRQYWYRWRAVNAGGTSINSGVQSVTTTAMSGSQTFTQSAIARSNPEITNPMRGEYAWYGYAADPPGFPLSGDVYTRWNWRLFEPTLGNYNWSMIDNQLIAAKNSGGRFGFRLMSVCSGCGEGTNLVPQYIADVCNGFMSANGADQAYFIPDWNNNFYLTRVEALATALANRYGNDERFGWIEPGPLGNYGEFHNSPFSPNAIISTDTQDGCYPGPNGQTAITPANSDRLFNAYKNAFAGTHVKVVCLTSNTPILTDATNNTGTAGTRVDALGTASTGGGDDAMARYFPSWNHWPQGIVMSEWAANISPGDGNWINYAVSKVKQYHMSMVSSGNYSPTLGDPAWSAAEVMAHNDATKWTGYRIQLDQMVLGNQTHAVASSFTSTWQNVNVAPTYDDWQVWWQWRTPGTTTVVGQVQSTYALASRGGTVTGLLPTNGTPYVFQESLVVPNITPGTYDFAVKIVPGPWMASYSPPLKLAITTARASDGAYVLGSITVA